MGKFEWLLLKIFFGIIAVTTAMTLVFILFTVVSTVNKNEAIAVEMTAMGMKKFSCPKGIDRLTALAAVKQGVQTPCVIVR